MALFIALASLLFLVILHELGHFFVAKKFNVKVEEFGIGIPPRIFGKKIGETIWSINLLPFGAFVRLLGEEKSVDNPRSFSVRSPGQRALIVAGGVIAFWIIAVALFSLHAALATPVKIVEVDQNSPAMVAGIQVNDVILELKSGTEKYIVTGIIGLQSFVGKYRGKEITLLIKRGEKKMNLSLVPRANPPEGEGLMGVALDRANFRTYSWWEAPLRGIQETGRITYAVISGILKAVFDILTGQGVPPGAEVMGPVGITVFLSKIVSFGLSDYIWFMGALAIFLAVFNALPIPAVDGGKLMFLAIEAIRKKPLPETLEQKITGSVFIILIILLIILTLKDISRIF